MGLYAAVVFISGWTFLDYYFRSFALDPRSLDLDFHETMIRGFTVFRDGGLILWCLYAFLIAAPLILEVARTQTAGRLPLGLLLAAALILAVVLVGLIVSVHLKSRDLGLAYAAIDRGPASRLPQITFTTDERRWVGKLLFFRDGTYFIHDAREISEAGPSQAPAPIQQLTVLRADEVTQARVVEPHGGRQ